MTALTRYLVDPHNFQTFTCEEGENTGKVALKKFTPN
jgi:hypothetical protein